MYTVNVNEMKVFGINDLIEKFGYDGEDFLSNFKESGIYKLDCDNGLFMNIEKVDCVNGKFEIEDEDDVVDIIFDWYDGVDEEVMKDWVVIEKEKDGSMNVVVSDEYGNESLYYNYVRVFV